MCSTYVEHAVGEWRPESHGGEGADTDANLDLALAQRTAKGCFQRTLATVVFTCR